MANTERQMPGHVIRARSDNNHGNGLVRTSPMPPWEPQLTSPKMLAMDSSRDMLEKLRREIERLAGSIIRQEVVDHALNAAMTAWHLTLTTMSRTRLRGSSLCQQNNTLDTINRRVARLVTPRHQSRRRPRGQRTGCSGPGRARSAWRCSSASCPRT